MNQFQAEMKKIEEENQARAIRMEKVRQERADRDFEEYMAARAKRVADYGRFGNDGR